MSSVRKDPAQPDLSRDNIPPARGHATDGLSHQQIGPYKILEVIAEGGMGVVYLAEQREPVKRQVALKVIKPGMDTKEVLARFEAERQALAVMGHPHIAKVYDGGATEAGRPYFVMELVRGMPITEYCDEHKLTVRQRLELFIPVCQAIQHAHQKGVIHRDLKPSNILVAVADEKPLPKVIDFGIAKAIDQRLTEQTVQTRTGHLMGTPAYISPEQAEPSGLDIDTRTDIYALGVILYELLAGELPFEANQLQGLAVLYTLLVQEPPTPSVRFSGLGEHRQSVADLRRTDPPSLARKLRGDLDWIVMKAMEKDRARRYETANALAFEILRYLNDEPVLARAPSKGYRLGKFVKRHKAGVAAGSVVAAALLVSSIVISFLAFEATRARGEADRRSGQAEDLISFMLGDLRAKLEPVGRLEVLDDVGDKALEYFAALPEEELSDEELFRRSQALTQIGEVRIAQGDLPAALEAFRESLDLSLGLVERDPENGDWQVGLGAAYFWVGYIHWLRDNLDAALEQFLPYLAISSDLAAKDPDNLDWQLELGYAYSNIGSVREAQGDLEGALDAFQSTLALKKALVEEEPENLDWQLDLAHTHNTVGVVLRKLGDLQGAGEHFWADLAIKESLVARDSANSVWLEFLATSHAYLGDLLEMLGDLEAAMEHYAADLRIARELHARDTANAEWQRSVAASKRMYGLALLAGGDIGRASEELHGSQALLEALVARDTTNADWKRNLAAAHRALAQAFHTGDHIGQAQVEAQKAVAILELLVEKDPQNRDAQRGLSESYLLLGRAFQGMGQRERARDAWALALEAVEPFARASRETKLLASWALALLHLERSEEAAPIVETLVRRGYRRMEFVETSRRQGVLP